MARTIGQHSDVATPIVATQRCRYTYCHYTYCPYTAMSLHSNVAIVATPIVATPTVAAQRCHYLYYSCTYCRYTKMLLHLLSLHQDVAAYTVATFNVVHTHCRYTKMFALIVARCGFTRPYYGLFAIYSSAAGSQSTHMSPSSPRVMIENVHEHS